MGTTFIYALCEPGTRTVRYIGKANNPKRRLNDHLRTSIKENNHLGRWLQSLDKKPTLVVLSEVLGDQWKIEEKRYINSGKILGLRLTNSTDGGDGVHNPSAETRAKKSGKNHPFFGIHLPPEMRAKIRASHMGKKATPEARANMSLARVGKKASLSHCANISAAMTGENHPMFGKIHREISKEKISNSLKGKAKTPEARANMRAALIRRYAARKATQQ